MRFEDFYEMILDKRDLFFVFERGDEVSEKISADDDAIKEYYKEKIKYINKFTSTGLSTIICITINY